MSIAVTERELAVLRWVGEQYVAPMGLVAELLVNGEPRAAADRLARRAASRLQRLGYAVRWPALGRVWLVPTRRGLRTAGLPYRAWDPERHEWSLKHVEACGRLRLELERCYPEGTWESDRAIRSRWAESGARVRLADGGLHWSDGQSATGVELERYVKRLDRYESALADQDPAWNAGVWWFTPAGQVELLRERLRAAGAGDAHEVYPLSDGIVP